MARAFVPPVASAGDRKVVLMRLLAQAEVERLGIEPTHAETVELALWFQREFGLEDRGRFTAWLEFAGLDLARFSAMMRRFAALTKLVHHYRREIDDDLADHLAFQSARTFAAEDLDDRV